MANNKKFVVKNGLTTSNIEFKDDINNGTNTITMSMLSTDVLSFSGDSGQLFSISDSLTGTIFSVNDISGIPSLEVDDDGTIRLAEFAGNIIVGSNTDNGSDKLQVTGNTIVDGTIKATDFTIGTSGKLASNNFVKATFTSNNYLQSLGYTTNTGDVSNNYLQGLGFTTNVGDVTNTYLTATFSSNNYLQGQLSTKLNSSSYTASDVLTKIKTVDGSGSGLDADTLDGLQGSSYVSNNYVDGRFTSNTFLVATFTTNNYIQSYVSSEVASLVDSAPATLDTLNELAAALGDDANFATTVSTQIGIRATNTYVNSTFSSNNYLQGLGYTTNTGDVSNNYLQSLGYTTNTGDVSNNYLQGLGFTTNVGDVTNTYLTATFSSNNYLQGQLGDKLNSSSYTASDVLTKIKTVDGSGSGLDADTLDSLQVTSLVSNNYFQDNSGGGDVANSYLIATFTSNNYIQTQLGTKLNSSSYTASDVLTKIKTVDGSGSGLDADLLDGQEASAFQTVAAPNAPSITSTTVVNETIEMVFGQSSTSGVTRYEVWSDGATGSDYSLISIIPAQDAAASMSVVDLSFDTGGTVAYRVYAIKNGVYSTAATTTKSFTIPSLDVTNMSVVSSITNYDIQYDLPETRFLDHIEIYKDAETTLVALSRTGAALIYSGSSDNFTYNVPPSDKAKYHQFWVEVVSV